MRAAIVSHSCGSCFACRAREMTLSAWSTSPEPTMRGVRYTRLPSAVSPSP